MKCLGQLKTKVMLFLFDFLSCDFDLIGF